MRGLAHLGCDAGLPGRIRGAFGARLAAAASAEALAGGPCAWTPVCAFEALFRRQGRMSPGFDYPTPWVIGLDPHRGDLDVTLSLFGFADDFLAAAVEAMTAALAHDVDWRGQTDLFVPKIEILGRRVVETQGIAPPPPAERFILDFISPLALSGADPRDKPASLITGLGRRLEALARWHDATLGEDFKRPALAELARALDYEFVECAVVSWTRGSRRQDRAIPMRGLVGRLEIGGAGAAAARVGGLLARGAPCPPAPSPRLGAAALAPPTLASASCLRSAPPATSAPTPRLDAGDMSWESSVTRSLRRFLRLDANERRGGNAKTHWAIMLRSEREPGLVLPAPHLYVRILFISRGRVR